MNVDTIIQQCGIWLASVSGGVLLLKGGLKLANNIVTYIIRKKPITLSQNSIDALSKNISSQVSDNVASGIEVEVSGQIDASTNKRLSLIEDKTNEYISDNQRTKKLVKAIGRVISKLQSPDPVLRKDLEDMIDGDTDTVPVTKESKIVASISNALMSEKNATAVILNKDKHNKRAGY